MSLTEIMITFVDESTVSYILDSQTTLAQLRDLLKEDKFISGDELFITPEQKNFIPKSQEKTNTIQRFKIEEVARIGMRKKTAPKIIHEEEKKEEPIRTDFPPTKSSVTPQGGFENAKEEEVFSLNHKMLESGMCLIREVLWI